MFENEFEDKADNNEEKDFQEEIIDVTSDDIPEKKDIKKETKKATKKEEVIKEEPVVKETKKEEEIYIPDDNGIEAGPITQDGSITVQPVKFASFDKLDQVEGEENKNLDILMDVKLHLNVELGRTELPIKKVLELTRGSIIELDKVAGEPVELFANGKLIAQGEVVVIDDNFGLRITSIVEPDNRIN